MLGAAVVAALLWAWWPRGNYRPIQSYERGVLQQAVAPTTLTHTVLGTDAAGTRILHAGDTGHRDDGLARRRTPLPTPGHPRLAMVLTPRDPSKPTWVFPFNRPAAPGAGDNQAMAIATKDGSTAYDVAFALVYADKDTVLNKNEAYAFAELQPVQGAWPSASRSC